MKTPEEIALIGGGILLSSGLVFGLKSGAASELPNVSRSVDTVLQGKKNADSSSSSSNDRANSASQAAAQQKQQQEQAQQQAAQKQQAFENSFDGKYQKAQQNHWQTGNWGSAKFYVDDNENMHVGGGQLSGSYSSVVDANKIKTINLDGAIQAPQDSSSLFARTDESSTTLTQINGLSNLDTSNVNNMENMFADDSSLSNLDLSHFDTHNVNNMIDMFYDDNNLSSLNISNFDTSNVTSNATNMVGMFNNDNIHQLTLGSNTILQSNSDNAAYLSGTYQNGSQNLTAIQLINGQAHPGTWYQQLP